MPDVGVAVGILQLRMPAVLRRARKTIQRTVVQAMAVGVAGFERNPAGKPLGQGGLQAVVVGTRIVLRLVDKRQVGEFGLIRTDAGRRIDLIEVESTG